MRRAGGDPGRQEAIHGYCILRGARVTPGGRAMRLSAPARQAAAILLLLSGLYLLTMSGHTYSADEETMVAVTRGIVESGRVAVVVEDGAPVAALRPGLGGLGYSPYGVLPSLLALPLYALGALAGALGPAAEEYAARLAVGALNGPVTAATAAVLALWSRRLGASRGWALALALLYGFCTFAWPYARTFFSEPLAALLLLVAAERADAGGQRLAAGRAGLQGGAGASAATTRRASADFLCSGLAAGLLLATRIASGVALPAVGLYVLWHGLRAWRRADSPAAVLGPLVAWAAGLLPGLALVVWYNLARFGTPLATGYASEAELFTTPLGEGLYGLLLSSGKGVIWYAPPLLLALPGSWRLWRRGAGGRGAALLAWALFLGHLLLYARWGEWQGGGVWGPRFLLPVVAPLLALAAGLSPPGRAERGALVGGAAVPSAPSGRPAPFSVAWAGWSAAVVLGLLGLAGNLGGVLLNFNTYVVAPAPADKVLSWEGSPLVGHWRALLDRWGRYAAGPPSCRLGDGLFPSEDPGGPLPRRAGASAELRCALEAPARLRFSLDDRRPPAAPPSELRLLLDGRDLGPTPAGQLRDYRLLLPPGGPRLELRAAPWNPLAAGFSPRDDELGPLLAGLRGAVAAGGAVRVVDTAVAPVPARPAPRWAWYYDPPNQHLLDHWAWYLPRSELAGPAAWAAAGCILLLGVAGVAAGARLALRPE